MAAHSNQSGGDSSDNVEYYQIMARWYDLFFLDDETSMEAEGGWLHTLLCKQGSTTVLDASCGDGRQTIPLARRGYRVTAADPSRAMLDRARARVAKYQAAVEFLEGAFCDLPALLSGPFDAVLALGNGLCNLASRTEIEKALTALRAVTADSGFALIGIKDFDSIRADCERFHGHRIRDDDQRRTVLFETWDIAEPLLQVTAFVLEGPRDSGAWTITRAATHEYMLGSSELRQLALAAGFTSVSRIPHEAEAVFLLQP